MDKNRTAMERAFELARSGKFATITEIKKCLKHEGYDPATITGPTLTAQIRELISKTKGSKNS
jgi:hypothetical protein